MNATLYANWKSTADALAGFAPNVAGPFERSRADMERDQAQIWSPVYCTNEMSDENTENVCGLASEIVFRPIGPNISAATEARILNAFRGERPEWVEAFLRARGSQAPAFVPEKRDYFGRIDVLAHVNPPWPARRALAGKTIVIPIALAKATSPRFVGDQAVGVFAGETYVRAKVALVGTVVMREVLAPDTFKPCDVPAFRFACAGSFPWVDSPFRDLTSSRRSLSPESTSKRWQPSWDERVACAVQSIASGLRLIGGNVYKPLVRAK